MRSIAFVAAATMVSALVFSHTHATENFAPDITNGDAYRNNAIIGLDSKTSYIRLANFRDSQEPVRNYVEVYSLTAQKTLGRFEIDVRSKSSIQLSYRSIMGLAGISLDDAAAQDLVLYIQNGREKQLWQHVQYDLTTRTLNNATVCSTAPHTDYIAPHNVLMNVHSSSMPTHTSLITIHNFTDIDTTMQANIYNAASGEAIGFVPLRLPARSSFNETAAWFEDQMNFKPTAAQYHYSIELVPTSVPQAKVVVGHVIANLTTGAGTNLSNPCALHGGIISLDDPT